MRPHNVECVAILKHFQLDLVLCNKSASFKLWQKKMQLLLTALKNPRRRRQRGTVGPAAAKVTNEDATAANIPYGVQDYSLGIIVL